VLVIPSIDLEAGRSRLVHWPGAATGVGTASDRPEVIARRFVAAGAPAIHLVDLDGARAGRPMNLEAIARIASAVALPLQVAGGVENPDAIRLVFAAGATRVVVGVQVVDDPERLAACLQVAGEWLAVGLDARVERLTAYPWRRQPPPTMVELVDDLRRRGVTRFVLAHGRPEDAPRLVEALRQLGDLELVTAGGIGSLDDIRRLRDAGASGVIVGEPLYSGAIDLAAAVAAAA
jgi:phosphoribosylformimino-5-aminoimidazole carboxamide ribotide isomerase